MKAVVIEKYGGPEVLSVQDVPMPLPKSNEVLVQVNASCLTRASAMMRSGTPRFARLFLGLKRPKNPIPGSGFAGIVVKVGSDVLDFEVGDAVFGETAEAFGTNAEFICIPDDRVILPMPDHLSFEKAAIMCDGPVTSYNFLKFLGEVKPGQKVLINGASGSLGVAAVQIAKYMGAEVTGVCSGANAELVKSLGADHVIDYTKEDFTQSAERYDVVYDTVGKSSFGKAKKVLTENGRFLTPVLTGSMLLPMLTNWTRKKKAKFDATGLSPVAKVKTMLKALEPIVKQEHYDAVLERRYSMEQVVEAHQYIDSGRKRGNIVMSL